MNFRWDILAHYEDLIVRGIGYTLFFALAGEAIGLILGLVLAFARLSRNPFVRVPASAYVDVFRGTPLFVQIFIIHFAVIPGIFGASQGPVVSGVVALGLNSAAYVAEIFRAGIQSVARGQMEAARSLGLTHWQAMRYVILPQALRRVLPPLTNEFIALLKDSSLLAAISAPELTFAARTILGATLRPWEAFLPVAFLYFLLTTIFTQVSYALERRFAHGRSDE
ncbi:MAG: amino acid ABC transporter permease [Brockia lithotrophica]|nr:amino acid ABC transporter permease [Brockia lithotrophica]